MRSGLRPATRPAPPSQPAKATKPEKKVVPAVPDKPLAESIRDLQDPSPEVRMQAAQAVAKHGAKAEAAVPALNGNQPMNCFVYVRRSGVDLGIPKDRADSQRRYRKHTDFHCRHMRSPVAQVC